MADENKQVVIFPDEQEVVVDRGRITHKQSKRANVLYIQLQKASKETDATAVETILEELDQITGAVIVSVPSSWLPQGVTIAQANWMDFLSEDKYQRLMELASPPAAGEKKV